MGLIGQIFGRNIGHIGKAVEQVTEVFVANKTKEQAAQHAEHIAAQGQFAVEFTQKPSGLFDRFVNGLNRLPRPILALGTVGLFTYAMADPVGFSTRMIGLEHVPEPLWWLLGAIVSFYFGARELHHFRHPTRARTQVSDLPQSLLAVSEPSHQKRLPKDYNAALEEWRARSGNK